MTAAPPPPARWREVAGVFLRLGATAFGGPAAHIALMERDVVRRRGWVAPERFVDYLGAVNLIPGPNSTEMTMLLGQARAGRAGLVLGGVCFILPAALLTAALAWGYQRWGALPAAQPVLHGLQAAVVPLVAVAVVRLALTACRTRGRLLAALAAGGVAWWAGSELLALFLVGGAYGLAAHRARRRNAGAAPPAGGDGGGASGGAPPPLPRHFGWKLAALGVATAAALGGFAWLTRGGPVPPTPGAVALYFYKLGSVLYGSGYVLFAFLQGGAVEALHWLTPRQLVDAVAAGQFTPGPLFSTATFAGYVAAGPWGAAGATVGIFLPGFLFAALLHPLAEQARARPATARLLDGINAAAVGLMAGVAVRMAAVLAAEPRAVGLALALAPLYLLPRLNSVWVLALGAGVGAVWLR